MKNEAEEYGSNCSSYYQIFHFITNNIESEINKIEKRRGIGVKRGLIIICAFIIAIFLLFPGCSSTQSPLVKEKDRDAKWKADLDYLTQELPKRHKNLFFQLNRDGFYLKMNELKSKIKQYSDEEMKVELSKVIASVGDAHTMVAVDQSILYPLKLYWFTDGIYVIRATKDYEKALYYRVDKINNKDIDSILKSLKNVISHENEQWYKLLVGYYMVVPEVLKGLQISTNNEIMVSFVMIKGKDLKWPSNLSWQKKLIM